MEQLNAERVGMEPLKPCDVFDLIRGTSTGGLIAIMLGRLEMDIDECLKAYNHLMTFIFSEKINNLPVGWSGNIQAQYDSRRLKSAIEDVIIQAGASLNDLMKDGITRKCRAFVLCEAALATAAGTGFFEPVMIDDQQYVDGAFSANNPIEEVEGGGH
ncbi:Patatin/Phospholipase A2-related protein [Penicillium cosmopolitanum]|uniref:Patatin/Phospholipase A2-related protein n=1 Tax=Penicillium cosmopolitanum TaxID=1131564 RepID=A0A9W9W6R5_9EURO|nr:Patatin/Phospholipase A2-related protein [Penicillium cosmopolitanum]KAJ5404524.1 Patatin/Phospholipase A2-related protein [Penicillium cosmopolitanum]